MYINEKQIEVSLNILKAILDSKNGFSDLKKFIYSYNEQTNLTRSYIIDEYIEKAIKKNKIHKKIEPFYSENKEFIHMIREKGYYYNLTNILFITNDNFNWFLSELEKVDNETLSKFVKSMENLGLKEFIFTELNENIQSYILIQKKFFDKKTEFSTVLTDGKLFFLGRYDNESYPYLIRNAKYIFEIHNPDKILNKFYISSFNVDLPTIEEYEETSKNVPNLNSKELKERTAYIRYLFELYKMKTNLSYNLNNVNNCKKLLETENKVMDSTIQMINTSISEIENKIEEAEKISSNYGFDEGSLQLNMGYMESCQRNMDYDID